eukprot:4309855-Prymnesium_polylepis.1
MYRETDRLVGSFVPYIRSCTVPHNKSPRECNVVYMRRNPDPPSPGALHVVDPPREASPAPRAETALGTCTLQRRQESPAMSLHGRGRGEDVLQEALGSDEPPSTCRRSL